MYYGFLKYLQRHGMIATAAKLFAWAFVFIQKNLILLLNPQREQVFNKIYAKNYWASAESVSGRGSELKQTEKIRKELPKIFEKYDCTSILDAPCGDFNWMRHVIKQTNVIYCGGDIVDDLVEANILQYGDTRTKFIKLDICNDPLPSADIMVCRDCLFHLSYSDIVAFLENFAKSNIPLLLVTTHKNQGDFFKNKDIRTGDFRMIDLFSQPFGFPSNVLYRFDDFNDPEPAREMCLFNCDQISALVGLNVQK